ncbi:MAG: ribulose 1,5-bisphosphate carboxylase [Deltaproteobacteria bacterium]|nr:ribulose 1,5-bisphosphate carboxylase [Deltaproteobacteria bacterium]
MGTNDIPGFFAAEEDLQREEHLFLTYQFETPFEPRLAAATLCSEMSTAQWKRPGVTEDLRPRFGAKVVHLEMMGTVSSPWLAHATPHDQYYRCLVRIAYPHVNFGTSVANMLSVVAGEGAFFCEAIKAIKLLDIEFPASYLQDFSGPKFGIEGLRKILGCHDRPIFFGVVKPNIGLSPEPFAELAYEAWSGGLDVAKDDEMLFDVPWSPLTERCRLASAMCRRAEDETGEKKLYVANINADAAGLLNQHDLAVKNGAGAVLVNALAVGLPALRMLVQHATVPVFGHFAFIAPITRVPYFGISSVVITKLERLVGCDIIGLPGFGPRMFTEEEEVLDTVDVCRSEFGNLKRSLPIPGGSDSAATLPSVYEKVRTLDFGFIAGRGIFGHPDGPRAGAMSLRQAWEAIVRRIPLEEYALEHPALEKALQVFSGSQGKKKALSMTPLHNFISAIHKVQS